MSTLALILVIGEATVSVAAILIAWHFATELDYLRGEGPARARVREAEDRFYALLRASRKPAAAPEDEPVPDHPRFGPLLSTPPEGIEVTRDDGVLSVRADLPVQRRRAEGDPFTGELPKLTDEAYEELRAKRPPTLKELREEYNRWRNPALAALSAPEGVAAVLGVLTGQAEQEMRRDYFDGMQPAVTESVTAWRPGDVTYQQVPQDRVEEAGRQDAGTVLT